MNHGNAAAAKIGKHHITPGLIDGDVAGAGAAGGNGVEKAELSGHGVDCVRAHVRRVIDGRTDRERIFADGVQILVIGRDGEERRIHHFGRELRLAQLTGGCVETANIDPLAFALANAPGLAVVNIFESSISAEKDEVVVALRRGVQS